MIGVPITIVLLGLVTLALLSGMPFGEGDRRPDPPPVAVVEEGEARPAASSDTERPPLLVEDTPAARRPATARVQQPAQRPEARREAAASVEEITEETALEILRSYISSRKYYDVETSCLSVGSRGYANAGYTLEVVDRCADRSLGRWRVDSKTREVFRQREDGRYLRP